MIGHSVIENPAACATAIGRREVAVAVGGYLPVDPQLGDFGVDDAERRGRVVYAVQADDSPGQDVGGAADDRSHRRRAGRRATANPPRSDRHAAAVGDERANEVGDLTGVVMTVGVEGDEEVAIGGAQADVGSRPAVIRRRRGASR